jgi:alkylmercury lyase
MKASGPPTIEQYLQAFESRVRQFSPQEQEIGGAIFRELAKGAALEHEQLRQALGISDEELRAALQRDPLRSLIHCDKQGRVLEFGGLSTVRTHHHFEVDGQGLFASCAGDALFLPGYIGRSARVKSRDPETGESVELTIAPDRIKSMVPESTVISFIEPGADLFGTSLEKIQISYCHFIFFFASKLSGEQWIGKHPGTFLVSVAEGFGIAKQMAARMFGAAPV